MFLLECAVINSISRTSRLSFRIVPLMDFVTLQHCEEHSTRSLFPKVRWRRWRQYKTTATVQAEDLGNHERLAKCKVATSLRWPMPALSMML